MSPQDLYGKVVRLHRDPQKMQLYFITNDKRDYLSRGSVTAKTVLMWLDNGLDVTIFSRI